MVLYVIVNIAEEESYNINPNLAQFAEDTKSVLGFVMVPFIITAVFINERVEPA